MHWVNHYPVKSYLFKKKKIILMSKGIAIQTILYLLVGILVVGIVIYMVYTYLLGPFPDEQECRSMAITWCTACSNAQDFSNDPDAWDDAGIPAGDRLKDCAKEHWGLDLTDCKTGAQAFCAAHIPS